MASSPLELLDLHVRTLFIHDDDDRLLAINEPRRRPAARFFLGRTAQGAIARVRHDLPAALAGELLALAAAEPVTAELARPPGCWPAVRALLAAHGPIEDDDEDSGPEYSFPDAVAAPAGPAAIAVTRDNAQVLARWLPDWVPDAAHGLPMAAVLVDGDAVAICACARLPGRACHAGVETHAQFRGHGYAAIATAAWAAAIRARGVVPLYGTSWSNHASQRVAARLGLNCYGASLLIS